MDVKQIYNLVRTVSGEVLGNTELVHEDLTGLVDLGNEVLNQNAVDNYVKSLVNHIGKVVFVNRPYSGKVPSVLMDAWEFGSVLEKFLLMCRTQKKMILGTYRTVKSTNRTFSTNRPLPQNSLTQR